MKKRLQFCLLSFVLVAGVFNVKTMASGPGCMPTGDPNGCGGGMRVHIMPTPPVGGTTVVAGSLSTAAVASGTEQTSLVTGVFNLNSKTMASGPGCMPTGDPNGCGGGLRRHPMRVPSVNGVIVAASLSR